jgi:hypothetical protein
MKLTPGVIRSYNRQRRTCRVWFKGVEGASLLPEAEFCYPIGDESEDTEIRITENPRVWLAFINDDPRYPVIMGFRPKQAGNDTLWRRFHHENIHLDAIDGDVQVDATADIKIDAGVDVDIGAGDDVNIAAGDDVLITAEDQVAISGDTIVITGTTSVLIQVGGSSITITGAQIASLAAFIDHN